MSPSDDIYAKEHTPHLARKPDPNSQVRPPPERVPSVHLSPASNPDEPSGRAPRTGAGVPDLQTDAHRPHRHRRRRRNGREPDEKFLNANRILWGSLTGVVLIYLVVLLRNTTHASRATAAPPPAKPGSSAVPDVSPPTAPGQVDDAARQETARIDEKIRVWEQSIIDSENGGELIDRKNLEKAEVRLQQGLQAAPQAIDLQLALTRVYMQQKRYDEAKDLLIKILDVEPNKTSARLALATILSEQQNFPAALSAAKWVLKADPYSIDAQQICANSYIRLGQHSQALPHLRRITSLESDNIMAQNNLAVVYTRVGQFDKAILLFNELLQRDPANSITHYNLAVCYVQQGKIEQAVDALNRAAGSFGASFVYTWLQGPDFDAVRDRPEFVNLLARLDPARIPAETASSGLAVSPNPEKASENLAPDEQVDPLAHALDAPK